MRAMLRLADVTVHGMREELILRMRTFALIVVRMVTSKRTLKPPAPTAVESPQIDFGTYVRDARLASELSIRKAAKLARISEGRFRQLERGYTTVGSGDEVVHVRSRPSRRTVIAIVDALDLDLDEAVALAGLTDVEPAPDENNETLRRLETDRVLSTEARRHMVGLYRLLADQTERERAIDRQAHLDLARQQ